MVGSRGRVEIWGSRVAPSFLFTLPSLSFRMLTKNVSGMT